MILGCSANTLRFADLPTRVGAAAAAGFAGIGLRLCDYVDAGLSDEAIRDLLDHHGVRVLELEHTWDWSLGEDPVEEAVFRLADRIGVRHLNVPMFDAHPLDELVEPFAGLCDRAAEHGVLVGFEFLPYSHVRTLAEAWRVVAAADRPNGGITFDLWHWFRSGGRVADLAAVPAEAIVAVQLCDVRPEPGPDLTYEGRHHRILPGQGAGDTAGVLRALRDRGVRAPVTVEVFSDELDAHPAEEAARLAYAAGAAVVAATGLPTPDWETTVEHR
ncbi:Sugar phosphate isomerase/epimerase [Pseudonocardia thermophila]|jgi:Sugar phosphate isomerases/epimerases|uniref:Sugar phosphate isomerase/epimerase n=1 Tax=Pseudonocardia thermophila TaxID=1848 RepID=A0A1M7A130_PSETH|nr:sugar phosphate isomerase/epimerase [Pseudonocardia thermophila]SHL36427.1 Sugar phosphate isomerase/epimerase [Pseudonocardia thermophila]